MQKKDSENYEIFLKSEFNRKMNASVQNYSLKYFEIIERTEKLRFQKEKA